jgi:hypothetical protein
MARAAWPLVQGQPVIEVALVSAGNGRQAVRTLLADTGAGSAGSPLELILSEADCRQFSASNAGTRRLGERSRAISRPSGSTCPFLNLDLRGIASRLQSGRLDCRARFKVSPAFVFSIALSTATLAIMTGSDWRCRDRTRLVRPAREARGSL